KSLEMLLHQVHLTYVARDGVVLVTTQSQARGRAVTKVHPVGDLVSPAEPVMLPLGKGDILYGWLTPTRGGPRILEETPEDELINLIKATVGPTSWSENGGNGTIDYFSTGKSLVVTQPPDVQEQIAGLLFALRRHTEME